MRIAAIFLLVGIVAAGCGKNGAEEVGAKPQAPGGTGRIFGAVRFVGNPPVMGDFPNAVCAGTQRAIPQESILVGTAGGLRNCLVYLQGVKGGDAKPQAVLDQVDCRYVPHVLGVIVGQGLAIRSEDQTPHNVHLQTAVNPPANYGFSHAGQETVTHFAYPEIFKVSCDVHPWMSAWVGVFSSPYFAVTDAEGKFQIDHVPAGDYTLVVWQERLGQKEIAIKIAEHQNVQENFSYAPSTDGPGG